MPFSEKYKSLECCEINLKSTSDGQRRCWSNVIHFVQSLSTTSNFISKSVRTGNEIKDDVSGSWESSVGSVRDCVRLNFRRTLQNHN